MPSTYEYPRGSQAEIERFAELQAKLPRMFRVVVNNSRATHTAVIVPSLSLPQGELAKIDGASFYEERLLCMLMLLRQPRMRIVLVTSQPIHPTIIDYYLHLLVGVPGNHARKRLTLLSSFDASPRALTEKVLERPSLLAQIKRHITSLEHAHLVCFNSTPMERTLSVQLGIPLYATDPALLPLGTKSGSRIIFRAAGVPLPFGFENLHSPDEIADALAQVWENDNATKKAVVKLDEGFSGEGNAIFRYEWVQDALEAKPTHAALVSAIRAQLHSLAFESASETWEHFSATFADMGGIVEAFIDGAEKYSPSVQCRVTPVGEAQAISTHDQLLGGPSGQVFLGCEFPARDSYRMLIQSYGKSVAEHLALKGVIGRFAVDFIVVRNPNGGFTAYGIEINLRKGGTTHPFLMLKFLTDGRYYPSNGQFLSPTGLEKYYIASDNVSDPAYRGLRPDDLVDISVYHNIHFSAVAECGVVFHLIGALSQYGKTGITAIGNTMEEARSFYNRTLEILNLETSPGTKNKRVDSLP